jgi:hypothetical protein
MGHAAAGLFHAQALLRTKHFLIELNRGYRVFHHQVGLYCVITIGNRFYFCHDILLMQMIVAFLGIDDFRKLTWQRLFFKQRLMEAPREIPSVRW